MNPETQRVIAFIVLRMSDQENQGTSLSTPEGTKSFSASEVTLNSINITDYETGVNIRESGSNGYFSQIRGSGRVESFELQLSGSEFSGRVAETGLSFSGRVSGKEAVFSSPAGNYRLS